MKRFLLLAFLAAGCASAPPREEIRPVRDLAPGKAVLTDLVCVSVESGAVWRVTLRNDRGGPRNIVWHARFRTADGLAIKSDGAAVRPLVVPAGGTAVIEVKRPSEGAAVLELRVGDQ